MPGSSHDDDAEPLSLRDLELPASSRDPARDARQAPPDRPTEPVSLRELEIVDDARSALSFDDDPVPMGGLERMLAPGATPRSISGGELEAVMKAATRADDAARGAKRGGAAAPRGATLGAPEGAAKAAHPAGAAPAVRELGAPNVGAQKVGAPKVGAPKVAPPKVGAPNVAPSKGEARGSGAGGPRGERGDDASDDGVGFMDLAHTKGTRTDDEHVSLDDLLGGPAAPSVTTKGGSPGPDADEAPDSLTGDLLALGSRAEAEPRRDARAELASLGGLGGIGRLGGLGGIGGLGGSSLDDARLLHAPPPSDPAMDPAPLSSRARSRRAVPVAARTSSAPPPAITSSAPPRATTAVAKVAPSEGRGGGAKKALLGLALVAAGAGGAFALMKATSTAPTPPSASATSAARGAEAPGAAARADGERTPANDPSPAPSVSAPTSAAAASARASAPLAPSGPAPSAPTATSALAKAPSGESTGATPSAPPTAATTAPTAAAATVTTPPPSEPAGTLGPFNKAAAQAALAGAASRAAACPADSFANVTVAVTFVPSGRSTTANLEGGPFGGTPTGECIVRAFRGLSVPPFEGEATRVRKSFGVGK